MPKVLTVVGTRPELIKLSRVIAKLDQHVDHVLVHTGQNFDKQLSDVFFDDLQIRQPDHYLAAAKEGAITSIASMLSAVDEVLKNEHPDAVLYYGDTNSCLTALAAKRRRIPIFHMEAGNRCFDQRVPEEVNRKIIDHISDINLTITEHARRYLIGEGIKPETIFKVGSSMKEVIAFCSERIDQSGVLGSLGIESRKYFLVSAHREENVDDPSILRELIDSLHRVAEKYSLPIVVSTHPRTMKRLQEAEFAYQHPLINFIAPFGLLDYLHLQEHAYCVISDSGTLTEESSILKFPAVMIREAHERPEGMDEGTVVMSGLKAESLLTAIEVTAAQVSTESFSPKTVPDYDTDDVSTKVLRIILSYIEYVKRTTWYE